jgi:hypothetical protein
MAGEVFAMFGLFKKKRPPPPPRDFPPVPKWRPTIAQSVDEIAERAAFYTNRARDFVVFRNGTCVFVPNGLTDSEAEAAAKDILSKIFNYHPDMNPVPMKDGNLTVQYNHPAMNIVFDRVTKENWAAIERNHQDALATHEVLITPLGHNKFDDLGKKALFGRCFMFMDAQDPVLERLVRATV